MKRRQFIALPLAVIPVAVLGQSNAHISTTDPLVFSLTKGRDVVPGKVKLALPAVADNGNSVAMTVSVDSPMTEKEFVRAVHLISEKNPVRDMATFYLGAHSGRAEVSSRIRLNGTQKVVALAELSDGTFWSAAVQIEVREAACTDGS
ncbi:MAG: thiosulfate oxidation carrier protein SoxY [Betaproteobacteria bacterium]